MACWYSMFIIRTRLYCTVAQLPGSMSFKDGSLFLTLKLPSKKDRVHFGINFVHQTVDDISNHIKNEDDSIREIKFCALGGGYFSKSTKLLHLIDSDFTIKIDGETLNIDKSGLSGSMSGAFDSLSFTKIIDSMRRQVYNDDLLADTFESLRSQLESVNKELVPLEQQRSSIVMQADRRTRNLLWLGLFSMGVQAGFLGRLVWYEYSWDIMEPVTYFVTYTAVIGGFAYFVITRKPYEYDDAKQRIFDDRFYKLADKYKFDVKKYERLKLEVSILESKLSSVNKALLGVSKMTAPKS